MTNHEKKTHVRQTSSLGSFEPPTDLASHLSGLPLRHKLDFIKNNDLDPKSILSKAERRVTDTEKKLSIPEDIKNLHLKPLLHKQALKVNKWVKNSLRAKTRLDFDTFMSRDK